MRANTPVLGGHRSPLTGQVGADPCGTFNGAEAVVPAGSVSFPTTVKFAVVVFPLMSTLNSEVVEPLRRPKPFVPFMYHKWVRPDSSVAFENGKPAPEHPLPPQSVR